VEGGQWIIFKKREPGLVLLVVDVGPLPMRPTIVLLDLGVLGVKLITLGSSPFQ
jgi:hypothetical protein